MLSLLTSLAPMIVQAAIYLLTKANKDEKQRQIAIKQFLESVKKTANDCMKSVEMEKEEQELLTEILKK